MMKLYWAPKTRAFRTLWMLEEAGTPYELVRLELDGPDLKSDAFAAVNPMRKVPALEDGDVRLAESGAICFYVAERTPGAGLAPLPGESERGRYLQWMFFDVGCVEAAFVERLAHVSIPSRSAGWGSYDRVMDVIEGQLADKPWILGDRFSAADVMLGCDIWYGINLLKVIQDRPVLAAYSARCAARPAFLRAEEIEAAA